MLTSNLRIIVLVLCLLLPGLLRAPEAKAQEDRWSRGSVGTGLLLRRLDGVKRVLMIGAHPDDEDTSLLTALSRGKGVETAYLSLSRGEGGQNLLGPELDEGLGILRTGELLAARSLDGGQQFFSRAFDFGYSKTAEETFRYWPREELLRDATWVVRSFRPQVIISVFSGTPRDGHGHHQAAGIVAQEVFQAAADPTRFPEQLEEGLTPWAPAKLYRRTRGESTVEPLLLATGEFDPLLGRSHYQVAMESRSQHRSQDMGMPQPLGSRESSLTLVESRVSLGEGDGLFAGVDTALLSLTEGVASSLRSALEADLTEYREAIADARRQLALTEPWEATPALGRALEALRGVQARLASNAGGGGLGGEAGRAMEWFLEQRIPLVREAVLRSAGVVMDVAVERDLLIPGEAVGVQVDVWNGGPFPLDGVSTSLAAPEGWRVAQENPEPADRSIGPGSLSRWEFAVLVPDDAEPSRPYYLQKARDGELYRWPEDRTLWARARNPEILQGVLDLTVGSWPVMGHERSARFRGVDKARGEYVEPVLVVPPLSVTLEPRVMAWPTADAGAPRELAVTLLSHSPETHSGSLSLEVPDGWEVRPESHSFSLSSVGEEASFSFQVSLPPGVSDGFYSVRAQARTRGGKILHEDVSLVDYPHIPRGALFREAAARISVFPARVPEGTRVGYVMGSGDMGPEAIRQLGLEVDLLGPEAVRSGNFGAYDVVVLGIRAYETRPDLAAANEGLLDYARAGGTVIVQYNKYEFPRGGYAPFPVGMSRPHDRVSDETVPVRILEPDHPLFTSPNQIGPRDFQGWAQERGLYFLGSWDERYQPLLELADPGEAPKRGGLVVAPLGDGAYVYTGLAFFRQFPEGVPGAYRLFANLLGLRGADLSSAEGLVR